MMDREAAEVVLWLVVIGPLLAWGFMEGLERFLLWMDAKWDARREQR